MVCTWSVPLDFIENQRTSMSIVQHWDKSNLNLNVALMVITELAWSSYFASLTSCIRSLVFFMYKL